MATLAEIRLMIKESVNFPDAEITLALSDSTAEVALITALPTSLVDIAIRNLACYRLLVNRRRRKSESVTKIKQDYIESAKEYLDEYIRIIIPYDPTNPVITNNSGLIWIS